MSIKTSLLVFAQAVLIQTISAQYVGPYDAYGCGAAWGAAPLAAPCAGPITATPCGAPWAGYGPAAFSASNGGGLATASASPVFPAGVSVLSENVYEGILAVGGALPFLGTVAIEGALPTAGVGAIAYGCGNGAVGITAEDIGAVGFAGIAGPGLAGPLGPAPIGYGPGCGCGPAYI